MGIDLFVSRSKIENHCGRLWAESNSGPGATFSFCNPRAPERGRGAQSPCLRIPSPMTPAERVMR